MKHTTIMQNRTNKMFKVEMWETQSCLRSILAWFQLYHGDQRVYWRKNTELPLTQVTDNSITFSCIEYT